MWSWSASVLRWPFVAKMLFAKTMMIFANKQKMKLCEPCKEIYCIRVAATVLTSALPSPLEVPARNSDAIKSVTKESKNNRVNHI